MRGREGGEASIRVAANNAEGAEDAEMRGGRGDGIILMWERRSAAIEQCLVVGDR